MITNCHKNIMGTVSFDGQFSGMRKPREFIVYPMQESGPIIKVQSHFRFGTIHLDTGAMILSQAHAHANPLHLQLDHANARAIYEVLPAEDVQTLRQWIKSTGGIEVGKSIVKSDNTGALAL